MKQVVIVGQYSDIDMLPTVFRFTVPKNFGREDVIELFDAGLQKAKAQNEDGKGMYAANYVCKRTGGKVEYIEPDQEIPI